LQSKRINYLTVGVSRGFGQNIYFFPGATWEQRDWHLKSQERKPGEMTIVSGGTISLAWLLPAACGGILKASPKNSLNPAGE
jgi:hypothetical protein